MDCAIWLNRSKIFSADEIPANFDIAAIRGYFLGGSLIKWLAAHGGQEYLPALEALSPSDSDLNNKLTEIFTQKKCTAPVHKADETLIRTIDAIKGVPTVTSSGYAASSLSAGSFRGHLFGGQGSYQASSFAGGVNSFYYGSSNSGSYNFGSYYLGSFSRRTWQWEWEWRYGSFRAGSFRGGSFGHGSFAGGSGIGYGSFRGGSFNFGSFGFGSFRFGAGSYRFGFGFDTGSYRGFPLGGSFRPITTDEYDEIMYRCLNMCPLNRFGYGIHLI